MIVGNRRYFVFTKGAKKLLTTEEDSWTDAKAAWIAAACAVGVTVFVAGIGMPLLKWYTNKRYDSEGKEIFKDGKIPGVDGEDIEVADGTNAALASDPAAQPTGLSGFFVSPLTPLILHLFSFSVSSSFCSSAPAPLFCFFILAHFPVWVREPSAPVSISSSWLIPLSEFMNSNWLDSI